MRCRSEPDLTQRSCVSNETPERMDARESTVAEAMQTNVVSYTYAGRGDPAYAALQHR